MRLFILFFFISGSIFAQGNFGINVGLNDDNFGSIKNITGQRVEESRVMTENKGQSEKLSDTAPSTISGSKVDAVYIATPNTLHCHQTVRALNAGKPVLCEKPFSISKRESDLMVAASKKNNVALLEGMWTRYLPHIGNIQKVISDGKIGNIESLSAFHHQNLSGINNPRLWTRELGGGSLLDLGLSLIHI